MPTIRDDAQRDFVVNGFRFSDWGSNDPPVEYGDGQERFTKNRGSGRGQLILRVNPGAMRGGQVKLHLDPDSPQVNWVLGELAAQQAAIENGDPHTFYDAVDTEQVQDSDGSYLIVTNLEGGVLDMAPFRPSGGQDFVVTFEFDKIITQPPPRSQA